MCAPVAPFVTPPSEYFPIQVSTKRQGLGVPSGTFKYQSVEYQVSKEKLSGGEFLRTARGIASGRHFQDCVKNGTTNVNAILEVLGLGECWNLVRALGVASRSCDCNL